MHIRCIVFIKNSHAWIRDTRQCMVQILRMIIIEFNSSYSNLLNWICIKCCYLSLILWSRRYHEYLMFGSGANCRILRVILSPSSRRDNSVLRPCGKKTDRITEKDYLNLSQSLSISFRTVSVAIIGDVRTTQEFRFQLHTKIELVFYVSQCGRPSVFN